ncbi:MAG: lipid II flippase MurJ, partial [Candidatus Undinarchaeales archaeon]|nr:lipid II flippase MurJ [Candidatus Undinarchaeales archaeon]
TRGMFYATERVERYLRLEAALAVCFFIALGAVVWRGLPLPLPFAVAYALFTVIALHEHRERLAPVREQAREVLADLTHFASRNVTGQFSMMARIRLGVIVASSFLAMEQAGLYAAAFALQSVFYFIPRAVNTVLAPAVSFSFGLEDRERIERILSEATRFTAAVTLLLGGACFVAAPLVLSAVYSSAFAPAATAFRLLLLATLATVIAQPAVNTLGATEHIHITGASGVVSLVVSLLAWSALLPAHGIEGIALGFLAGSMTNALIGMAFAAHHFRFSPTVAARPVAAAVVAALLGAGIAGAGARGQLIGVCVFCAVYIAATRQELTELARRVAVVVRERLPG